MIGTPFTQDIVDVHIHPDYPEKPRGGAFMAHSMVSRMDRFGVSISGILGHVAPFQTEHSIREWNSFTVETVKAQPHRLFGMCYIDPTLPASFVEEELERMLSYPEIRGIKLEIDINCRDARLAIVMEKALAFDAPVLHHSWYLNLWNSPKELHYYQKGLSEPHDIAELARRYPGVKILMAHMEGCGMRGLLDVAPYPNVWLDTSGSQPFSGTLEQAVKYLGADRIIFGSDRYGRGLPSQLGRVMGARISETDRKKILSHNAIELYKLHDLGGLH